MSPEILRAEGFSPLVDYRARVGWFEPVAWRQEEWVEERVFATSDLHAEERESIDWRRMWWKRVNEKPQWIADLEEDDRQREKRVK